MKNNIKNLNFKKVLIETQLEKDYLNYAMSVIISRALPDCRDGLKPVHRRILYAMYITSNNHLKPYRKSARIVGEVMGKYHPHGDNAIYASLVRMAQYFSLRLPLIDGQGNFGSLDGDAPAHMRYTEAKLALSSEYLLRDIDKQTVKFSDNYDGSESEPSILPAMFPNLLVNGASGIAVGMSTNIPTHNLREVIDACCTLIDNPNISDEKLMAIVPGPDFPTGGEIINAQETRKIMLKGRGTVVMRGKTSIIIENNKNCIVITEIPYQVNKSEMLKSIEYLMRNKIIDGIHEIRDETNKIGIRIVIELKKYVVPHFILNQLYRNTSLQSNYNVNMLALCNNIPIVMGVRKVLEIFISFRKEVTLKKIAFLLDKVKKKTHILIGVSIAILNIDTIITIIKSSATIADARKTIMERNWCISHIKKLLLLIDDKRNNVVDNNCYISTEQAQSILEMKLHKLTTIEIDKITKNISEMTNMIAHYSEYFTSQRKLTELIKNEFFELRNALGNDRKTLLSNRVCSMKDNDLISKERMLVILTKSGFIKRVALSVYKSQKRGGKGKLGMSIYKDDITASILTTDTHAQLLFFSLHGIVYKIPVYKLPLDSRQSKGRAIVNIIPLKPKDLITKIMVMPENKKLWSQFNIVFVTSLGNIRRNSLSDFINIKSSGKIAIRLVSKDYLVGIDFCQDSDHIFLATQLGKAVRFPISYLRVLKSRLSNGVKAIKLDNEYDKVISMSILMFDNITSIQKEKYLKIPHRTRLKLACDKKLSLQLSKKYADFISVAQEEQFILTITMNGFGKRTSCYEYRASNRNIRGVMNIDTGDRNGNVVSSFAVKNTDHIMVITNLGTTIRTKVDAIRVTSRNAKGVKIIDLKNSEVVVSVSSIEAAINES